MQKPVLSLIMGRYRAQSYERRVTPGLKKEVWRTTGEGKGFGVSEAYLHPELDWETEEQAKRAGVIAEAAYQEGYMKAKQEIRAALGVTADPWRER